MYKVLLATALFFMLVCPAAMAEEPADDNTAAAVISDSAAVSDSTNPVGKIYAFYFHGDVRCATCMKLEAYSGEALTAGFEKELGDSTLVWQTVNFDEEANKHYIDDFQLYTKALVLARVVDGKITEWKNLDKIWQLVDDKDKYLEYVRTETRKFIDGESVNE